MDSRKVLYRTLVGALLSLSGLVLVSRLPWMIAFALLAIAINFKIVGVLLVPIWLIGSLPCGVFSRPWPERLRLLIRRSVLLAVFTVGLFAPYVLASGWPSLGFIRYHGERGLHLESLAANLVLLLRPFGLPVGIEHSYGSTNITVVHSDSIIATAALATLGFVAAAVRRFWLELCAASAKYGPSVRVAHVLPNLVLRNGVLVLAIGVCGAKVFSPQYMIWFLPLVPIVLLSRFRSDATLQLVFALASFFTMLLYPVFFDTDVRPLAMVSGATPRYLPPTAVGLLVLTSRNALFAWMTALLWKSASRPGPFPSTGVVWRSMCPPDSDCRGFEDQKTAQRPRSGPGSRGHVQVIVPLCGRQHGESGTEGYGIPLSRYSQGLRP